MTSKKDIAQYEELIDQIAREAVDKGSEPTPDELLNIGWWGMAVDFFGEADAQARLRDAIHDERFRRLGSQS